MKRAGKNAEVKYKFLNKNRGFECKKHRNFRPQHKSLEAVFFQIELFFFRGVMESSEKKRRT